MNRPVGTDPLDALDLTPVPCFPSAEFGPNRGMNSKIQWIKRMACGHRNRQRFHNAIYFHLADLDLYPDSLKSTHTNA